MAKVLACILALSALMSVSLAIPAGAAAGMGL
jgi:hypothetical protein